MPKADKIRQIGIHCTAGFGNIESLLRFWKIELGWKNPGYHIIVDTDNGKRWYVTRQGNYSENIKDWHPELICNGIAGWNDSTIHIAYIGGVDKVEDKWIAKDTRTDAQKAGIIYSIIDTFLWLQEQGIDTAIIPIKILGHRDFSPDKNGNGVIEDWERIKECPSFDAIPTYEWITAHTGKTKLPKK